MADLSDRYNTELSEEEEAKFQEWLTQNNRHGDLADYDLRGWYKSGEAQAENGHFSDEFKKPNHPTFSNESKYHGKDGFEGGEWGGDEKKGWTFKPGKTNLENMTTDQLKGYFSEREPDATLLLPENEPEKPKKRGKLYDHPTSEKM